jgi:gamma-glutamyl hercynylcysteine S-oxide synthase
MNRATSATGAARQSPPGAPFPVAHTIDRDGLVQRYRRTRARSASIFGIVPIETRLARPIALRHPIIFYEGHIPAFYVNTLLKKGLGMQGVDAALERLFARGIDPESEAAAEERQIQQWPSRDELGAYVAEADQQIERALLNAALDRPDRPLLRGAQAVWACLEHEAMHQETLLYILHRVPSSQKRRPAEPIPAFERNPPPEPMTFVPIPSGWTTLGADDSELFGWDNEFAAHRVHVPGFRMARHKVTNADWLEFIDAGGYTRAELWTPDDWRWVASSGLSCPPFWTRHGVEWFWRGMFDELRLPLAWPVYVTHAEACAFARWRGGRLPTEAEYHRAAFGTPDRGERRLPWGDDPADSTRGRFDFAGWDPTPVGSHPAGASAWGIDELVGNGWEWTSTVFAPFPGFEPMASYPEYSADFFDGRHFVMKGASPATAVELVRRSFRNWFRPQYPYVYSSFRVVHEP